MRRIRCVGVAVLVTVALTACQPRLPRVHVPHDRNRDGYVTCEEDPRPDKNDLPCGFRDGIPV